MDLDLGAVLALGKNGRTISATVYLGPEAEAKQPCNFPLGLGEECVCLVKRRQPLNAKS